MAAVHRSRKLHSPPNHMLPGQLARPLKHPFLFVVQCFHDQLHVGFRNIAIRRPQFRMDHPERRTSAGLHMDHVRKPRDLSEPKTSVPGPFVQTSRASIRHRCLRASSPLSVIHGLLFVARLVKHELMITLHGLDVGLQKQLKAFFVFGAPVNQSPLPRTDDQCPIENPPAPTNERSTEY